eukprot:1190528-Prorocentrum_minimum.AAC.3
MVIIGWFVGKFIGWLLSDGRVRMGRAAVCCVNLSQNRAKMNQAPLSVHSGTFCVHSGAFCVHSVAFNVHSSAFNVRSGAFNIRSGVSDVHIVVLWSQAGIDLVELNGHGLPLRPGCVNFADF